MRRFKCFDLQFRSVDGVSDCGLAILSETHARSVLDCWARDNGLKMIENRPCEFWLSDGSVCIIVQSEVEAAW